MSTVLIVDDRAINREFLRILLNCAGFAVIEAADGSIALSLAQSHRPDLIITDLMMPVMDGLELTRLLRQTNSTADIPVVFYTATYRVQEARDWARTYNVAAVLSKPAEPQLILDLVVRLIGAPHAEVDAIVLSDDADARQQLTDAGNDQTGEVVPHWRGPVNALGMRLAAALELGLLLGGERDARSLLAMFCRAAQDIVHCRLVAVLIFAADNGAAQDWVCSSDSSSDELSELNAAHPLFARALQSSEPVYWAAAAEARSQNPLPRVLRPNHSALVMAINYAGARGALFLADGGSASEFDEEDVQFAMTLASQLALAYGNLKLYEQLQRHVGELQFEIAERRLAQQAIIESELRYRHLFEANPIPLWVFALDSLMILAVNDAAVDHYGYSHEQFLRMTILDIRPPSDRHLLKAHLEQQPKVMSHAGIWRHQKADGTIIEVEITSHAIEYSGVAARLVLALDVSERLEQDRRISRLSRVRAVNSGISSAMLRLRDRDELLNEACRVAVAAGVFPVAWISTFDRTTGQFKLVSVVSVVGGDGELVDAIRTAAFSARHEAARFGERNTGDDHVVIVNDLCAEPALADLRPALLLQRYHSAAAFPLLVDGRVVAVLVLLASEVGFFDEQEIALLRWMTADLSFALEHIDKTRRLDYLALYDELTGLPNARLFQDRLNQLVLLAEQSNRRICLVVMDLERFTWLNETYGRSVGDELLRMIGLRLQGNLIEPFVLGRISADTFAVASSGESEQVAVRLCDQLFELMIESFVVAEHSIRVMVQAGIAVYPGDGESGGILFKNAESALKLAKSGGQQRVYFSSELNAKIAGRMLLAEEIREALRLGQFLLHFQGRVDMISLELIGAEALVRWQHPQRGLLPPADFIDVAEETGLIVDLGHWVITQVCAQQSVWHAAGIAVPVAVNLSSVQFEQGNLLQTVQTALREHALPAALLDLELTESAVMNDPVSAAHVLQELRKLGVGLALDDFGTGYSSLAHLKRFPFGSVKIDRSFVTDITRNAEDAAIACAIIAMAHRLKLKVVAEGVETQGQFNYLRQHGCDEMQGFLFATPLGAVQFEQQLRYGRKMSSPDAGPSNQRTVLLVDDEAGIRSALNRVLRRDGYRILLAASGAEGLELLAEHSVQVIISDQRMPNMSGTVFLDTVRQLHPNTVRMILSGYTDLDVVTDAVNRGAVFKFLTKPWDDEQLREQVRDAFRRFGSELAS